MLRLKLNKNFLVKNKFHQLKLVFISDFEIMQYICLLPLLISKFMAMQ